jgi:hypothetical protein
LAALALLFYAKFLCHFSLSGNSTPANVGPFAPPPPVATDEGVTQKQQPRSAAVCATDIAHVFMFYLQCMWILSSVNVRYPATLAAPFQAVQWLFSASSPRSLGIDCILRDRGNMTVAAQEFVLSMFMPLAIMLVLLVLEILVGFIQLARRNYPRAMVRQQLHKLIATSIIVLTTFLPQLLRAVFGLFACVPLDEPVSAPYEAKAVGTFWVNHMSQQCWQGYHKALALGAGIPLVLLLCVLWPGSVLVFMLRHRGGSLYSSELSHYSFLFSMYKPSAAWWEVVVIVQTALLVAINVFAVRLGTYFGCVMLLTAYFLVFALLVWVRPYNSRATGAVATRGALCVCLTSLSTLLFMPAGTINSQVGAYERYALAVGVVVVLVNIAFVVSVVWQVAREVRWRDLSGRLGKVKGSVGRFVGVHMPVSSTAGVASRAGKTGESV